MVYVTCPACGKTVEHSPHCPVCGNPLNKWCPKCEAPKMATHCQALVIEGKTLSQEEVESTHCPDCGAKLEAKPPVAE